MDPLSCILLALANGAANFAASKLAQDVANKAVQTAADLVVPDAYNSLKALIKRKFESQGKSDSATILDKYEEKPEKTKALLEDELKEAGADQDEEIIKAAQKLLEQLNPQEAAEGKFNIQISGGTVQGLTQQNTGTITQNYS
ncbi:MAG: hypothetical protein U7123_14800 [Potamolinea sp.]